MADPLSESRNRIAVITGDEVRAGIVMVLRKSDLPVGYQLLKDLTEKQVRRVISTGSFNWHLKMLEAEGVITKERLKGFSLTKKGRETVDMIADALKFGKH